jgi:eukaryotic-like serine/threonine-protein kinase
MSSSPPTTLGKYQIIREIARSNDIVYEAYDPLMNRRVAVKELAMPGGSTAPQKEDRIKRFLREARAAGSLTHPNIMTVFEVGQEGERYFIAMEYLDGHTLRNEIDTLGFLPIDRALDIAKEVLRGLEFAHQHGVIHRDIKPDNIQLLSDGRIKLTDFGIARLTFEPNITMDGQVFGTPSYMSPEQVVGKEIDQRSDLFSVGVVLYEMVGGQKPFSGDSVVSITHAIMNKEPDRLQQANFAVWNVIAKALDKSPAMRYSNSTEMIEALDAAAYASQPGNMVLDQAPQPQHTIYGNAPPMANPYMPAPNANPYTTPYPTPTPPPVVFPYNPYTQTQGQAPVQPQPYNPAQPPQNFPPPGFQQPFPNPVFYPPPPRQPLVKPETRQFMGKLFVALTVLGTLMLLVIVVIGAISKSLDQQQSKERDQYVLAKIREIPSTDPLDQRISKMESFMRQLSGEIQQKEVRRQLAVLYEQRGKERLASNNPVEAEASFKRAIELDPDNGKLYSNLADLYGRQNQWQEAGEQWKSAATNEARQSDKDRYSEAAATSYYNHAMTLLRNNADPHDVRQALYDAQQVAPPNSPIQNRIKQAFDQLSQGL